MPQQGTGFSVGKDQCAKPFMLGRYPNTNPATTRVESMKVTSLLFFLLVGFYHLACSQGTQSDVRAARGDLYRCEGCEAIHEHDFDSLTPRTTIPPPDEPGERLILTGTVYQTDGKTPAANVVIYAYHTNEKGVYPTRGDETGWARRHGYLRGWVKTDETGRYQFDTIRPAQYPVGTIEAHIHMTVKEPGHREYYIDEVVFAGDPNVDDEYRRDADNRGGSGIIALIRNDGGVWHGTRDIILERHPDD